MCVPVHAHRCTHLCLNVDVFVCAHVQYCMCICLCVCLCVCVCACVYLFVCKVITDRTHSGSQLSKIPPLIKHLLKYAIVDFPAINYQSHLACELVLSSNCFLRSHVELQDNSTHRPSSDYCSSSVNIWIIMVNYEKLLEKSMDMGVCVCARVCVSVLPTNTVTTI